MTKSLLILGRGDTDYSDRNPRRLFLNAEKNGYDVQRADYHELGQVTPFGNDVVNIMFFFPYTFWNEHCEVPEDTQLYGTSSVVFDRFRSFFAQVKEEIKHKLRGYRLNYIIPPDNAALDRDKIGTLERLRKDGIQTSEAITYSTLQDIIDRIIPESGIFIKCRYGAEGKGITFLGHDAWVTNYRVEDGKLTNYPVNDDWPFADITGRKDLLSMLLDHEVVVEREIVTPNVFDGKKWDSRAYVIGEKVPHLFVRVNDPKNIITNYSKGATVIHHPKTQLADGYLRFIKEIALRAAQSLGSQFLGVDIMFERDETNGRIVEVQTFTDFPNIDSFNLARYMLSDESGLFI